VIVEILDGKASEGAVAATVLNAAAAIYVSGRVKSYEDGIAAARNSIASGQAKTVLERLRRATTKPVRTST
jgi:anthranilate phosphoribosyltransferase